MNNQNFKPVALVTGASRGLGLEISKELVNHGYRVAMVARSPEALAEAVGQVGRDAIGLVADVGDKFAIHRLIGEVSAKLGAIDLLINNASSLGPVPLRPLMDTDCEDLEQVLAVNLVGPFRLMKAVAGQMALRGRGLIVNISSDAAVNAYPNWGAYSVSKAALDHLSRIFFEEMKAHGVQAVAVDPGEMDTRMHADAIPEADVSTLRKPSEVAKKLLELILIAGHDNVTKVRQELS